MKPKNCLIFGGSGQIGRNLIRKLTKNNIKVTVVTRNIHQKSYIIKTQANAGYLDVVESDIYNEKKIRDLFEEADICINLIGIFFEKGKNTFENIHSSFPYLISKICKEKNINQFIQISALGIENAKNSKYASSKLDGEKNIKENFNNATILRPSVVYSVDDNFTTNFMSLLNLLPFFPLYYKGKTKFMPIHVSDLTEIILKVILNEIKSTTIECIGNETISLRDILKKLLKLIDKKRLLFPLPLFIANFSAKFFQLLPNPLITEDQLNLLAYDNITSGKFKTNFDIGVPSVKNFDKEVSKYSYMWKDAGQFSTSKYRNED